MAECLRAVGAYWHALAGVIVAVVLVISMQGAGVTFSTDSVHWHRLWPSNQVRCGSLCCAVCACQQSSPLGYTHTYSQQ